MVDKQFAKKFLSKDMIFIANIYFMFSLWGKNDKNVNNERDNYFNLKV